MFSCNTFDTAYERPPYFRNLCFSFFKTPKSDHFFDAILLTLTLYQYFFKCLALFIYPASSIKLNKCNSIKVIIIKCTIKVNDIKVFISKAYNIIRRLYIIRITIKERDIVRIIIINVSIIIKKYSIIKILDNSRCKKPIKNKF